MFQISVREGERSFENACVSVRERKRVFDVRKSSCYTQEKNARDVF